jgi:hypothetical protein
MLGNIIILAIAIGLLYFVIKVFGSNLKYKPLYCIAALFSGLVLIFTIIVPNIDFVKSPVTPSIHGKLIDAETKQPISNASVLVTYYYEYSIFMSLKTKVTRQFIITTQNNGGFNVGTRLRYLSLHFPCSYVPLITRQSGGRFINIWKNGYKSTYYIVGNAYYINKSVTKQDKLDEIHRIDQLASIAQRSYKKHIYDYIIKYYNELVSDTPIDINKMYWLEGKQ